jgi:hypothetical protein
VQEVRERVGQTGGGGGGGGKEGACILFGQAKIKDNIRKQELWESSLLGWRSHMCKIKCRWTWVKKESNETQHV